MEQESWLSNSADESTSRSGPGLSDASILSSITLALASSDGHLAARAGQLASGISDGGVLRSNPRLDAIRTDEAPEASSSTDGPASPVKRGRGRPKGSLDRNPRVRKDAKTAGVDNASVAEENDAQSSTRAGDTLDPQGNPVVKRKRGRPRKDRTVEPTTTRDSDVGSTDAVSVKSAAASRKPTVSYPITPERKEANRMAALRSRLRKMERASILEKMAAGLTEENVALKEKIQALNTLGFAETALQEKRGSAACVFHPTGYPTENPSDGTLRSIPASGMEKEETSYQAETPARETPRTAEHARQEGQISSPRALLPDSANTLQADIERRLQNHIDRLRSTLDSNTGWSLPSASGSSTAKEDVAILRNIAMRLRGENKKATQVVHERRDELLLLNQRVQHTPQRDEGEAVVDGAALRQRALRQHSEVEAAFTDMKRHLGQLMTHYDLAPVDVKESQFFTLPEKFMPIPLPQPMKRGRPSKPPNNQSEAEPPAKKPRRKSAAPPKADKVPQPKRPEQVRRYRVDGDPANIYIEKRQAVPGSAEDQVVEVTSRKVYNPRAQ